MIVADIIYEWWRVQVASIIAFQLNSNVGIILLNKFNSKREQAEFIIRLKCSRKFDRKKQPYVAYSKIIA